MNLTADHPSETAVRRYIAAAAAGSLATAESSIDGSDCSELYSTAAAYSTALLDQFTLEGEAPLAELVATLTDAAVTTWGLDDASAELVTGFAKLTAYEGTFDGVESYTAAVEAHPNEATSAALIYSATLAILVAEAGGTDTDTALDIIAEGR